MLRSLKVKLVIIIALLCAAVLALECFVTYKRTNVSFEDVLNENYEYKTDYFSSMIDGWMQSESGTLNAIESSVLCMDSTPEQREKSMTSMVSSLEGITLQNPRLSMVYVQLAEGVFLNGSQWDSGDFDGRTRGWYTKAVSANGAVVFNEPYVDVSSGGLIVTLSKYINMNNWEGVVGLDISVDTLLSRIDELVDTDNGKGEYLFITDQNGNVVYHPNKEFQPTPEKTMNISELGIDYLYAVDEDPDGGIQDYNGEYVYVTHGIIPISDWNVFYVSATRNYDNLSDSVKNTMITILIICLVVAIIVAVAAGIWIAGPITDASKKVKAMAVSVNDGNADLTRDIECKTNDEVGDLVAAVNELKTAMAGIISNINNASGQLIDNVQELKTAANISSDNASNISSTMEEMSATSEETSASTTQVSSQISDITELTGKVSANANSKAKDISRSLSNVEKLKADIERNDEQMNSRLNTAIETMKGRIADTKKVEEIQKMTQGISDVASQTNLLSLNASIEAARAGEAGRGFAVVADEIGQLANNSADMAKSIQEVSDDVLAIVDQLVKAAEEVSNVMLEISEENSKEKDKIISEYMNTLNDCHDAMSEISDNNTEIASNIERIKQSIDAIDVAVEENAQGITTVAGGTSELVSASDNVMSSANSVDRISNELKDHVKGFIC
ncbi:MAG: methyl-accepting chemotaxis protein [Lachnospiraceae bacterium]|nr:methyl-accepting chemotaxis protein [Lachnospiraceae bacterium]